MHFEDMYLPLDHQEYTQGLYISLLLHITWKLPIGSYPYELIRKVRKALRRRGYPPRSSDSPITHIWAPTDLCTYVHREKADTI